MNADSGAGNAVAPADANGHAHAHAHAHVPTVTVGLSTPTVNGGDVHVKLRCGAAAACRGTLAIESKPLAGTAAKKPKPGSATIIYAKGSFKLGAGADKSVSAPLTAKGPPQHMRTSGSACASTSLTAPAPRRRESATESS